MILLFTDTPLFRNFRRLTRLALICCLLLASCGTIDIFGPQNGSPLYYGTIESLDSVYDGDTIQDVSIRIYRFRTPQDTPLTLWPGIEHRPDGIYSVTDIRIAGIDTPETRPLRAGRTEASLQREKARAAAATEFLKQLLLDNRDSEGTLGFVIREPEPDKYAGRTVADVFVVKAGVATKVADALLDAGHAVVYTGGTKTHDWGAE